MNRFFFWCKEQRAFLGLIVAVFLLCLIPVVHTYRDSGAQWKGVVPHFVDDDVYYYARMNNVMHGYPMIGNPYFFEHRNDISAAFFIPDILSVLPMMLGVPFIPALVLNFIFWSMVFAGLVYMFFRQQSIPKVYASLGALLSYATVYVMILRPVSMQIVASFFILFCAAYMRWFDDERSWRSRNAYLILASAASFYIYTYLWQIVVVVLGITCGALLVQRQWKKFKHMCLVISGTGILSLPVVFYTLKQVHTAYYWETMSRIGLVQTHMPTALAVYDALLILVFLCLWYVSMSWIENFKHNKQYARACLFTLFTGVGLVITVLSNVLSGKELEIANHIERFIIMWISLQYVMYVWFVVRARGGFVALSLVKKIVVGVLLCLATTIFGYFLVRGFAVNSIVQTDTMAVQAYAAPLEWLDKNAPQESVIWSNGDSAYYIPVMTKNFQLFNGFGVLHVLSMKEAEERFLVASYFDNLTVHDIEMRYREYAGVGNAVHQYKTYNREVAVCHILRLEYLALQCGEMTDAVSLKGTAYFEGLYQEYIQTIQPHIKDELKKFNVGYILKDTREAKSFAPAQISGTKLLYTDGRFEIYSVNLEGVAK